MSNFLTSFQIDSYVVIESIIVHLPVNLEACIPLPELHTLEVVLQTFLYHFFKQLVLRKVTRVKFL